MRGPIAPTMAHEPRHDVDAMPPRPTSIAAAPDAPIGSAWTQPRESDGSYVEIERRELPALTSLRFVAAMYVVMHHLINLALLHEQGAGADRAATWYLAWGTQGHVGVTFFFVLSGFILAWCYHRAFSTADPDARRATRHRFWVARFARVWPLHAAMLVAFIPLALLEAGSSIQGLFTTAWQALVNGALLHAWVPFGGAEGLAETFNAPSWTLSVEALFYALFPLISALLVHRLRWGTAQLWLLVAGSWLVLGLVGVAAGDAARGEWFMRVFPLTRLPDFVIGVALGLIVVQGLQHARLRGATQVLAVPTRSWTALEATTLAAAACSPLVWALVASDVLPATLGTSWFHLPAIAACLYVMALQRGAISRGVLARRGFVWLGEVSYALYLVHMFIVLAAYRVGLYDMVGVWIASAIIVAASIAVSGVVHVRFEQPARAWIVARSRR